jgi:phage baseplate assembly protein W
MTAAAPGERRFLGVGWKFPLQVTPNGKIAQARAEQRVEESILLVLATARGERPMLPDFGCGIHDLVFSENNAGTIALVVYMVRTALVKYEPRIDVLDVLAESTADSPNLLLIRVSYRIRSTNAIGNLVYPFYITEGR